MQKAILTLDSRHAVYLGDLRQCNAKYKDSSIVASVSLNHTVGTDHRRNTDKNVPASVSKMYVNFCAFFILAILDSSTGFQLCSLCLQTGEH